MAIPHDQSEPDHPIEHRHKKKAVPSRSREYKWTRSSRKNARRKNNSGHTNSAKSAQSGMHRRRNRRMSW